MRRAAGLRDAIRMPLSRMPDEPAGAEAWLTMIDGLVVYRAD